jgi:uncharacterized protein YmfQ (DUF2313 family)
MGMIVQNSEQYANSIRKLFPSGEYWDKQFADPESDCSLFCKAKSEELTLFRGKMSDLFDESRIITATETLDDWERVLTGSKTVGLDPDERKALLLTQKNGVINRGLIAEVAAMFGWTIADIKFPYRPAFFAHARFGQDRIAGYAAFSIITIYANIGDKTAFSLFEETYRYAGFGFCRMGQDRIPTPTAASAVTIYMYLSERNIYTPFEEKLAKILLANYITRFNYGGS